MPTIAYIAICILVATPILILAIRTAFYRPNNLCPSCGRHNLQPHRNPGTSIFDHDGWMCTNPKCRVLHDKQYKPMNQVASP